MLSILEEIFEKQSIEINSNKERTRLHSHTSADQGLFLQKILEEVRPKQSLEVGLAYGISTLFILEKLAEFRNGDKSHIVIEPFPWDGVPEYNIEKAGLSHLVDYRYKKSDEVLPMLYYEKHKIDFAYVDTTKLFDVVLTDFYFIDKILEVGGIIVFDDCGGCWPGIQKVARYVNSLPHYAIHATNGKVLTTSKRRTGQAFVEGAIGKIPFKERIFPGYSFKSDQQLGLDYSCIAFKKISEDKRNWDFDSDF